MNDEINKIVEHIQGYTITYESQFEAWISSNDEHNIIHLSHDENVKSLVDFYLGVIDAYEYLAYNLEDTTDIYIEDAS